MCRVNVTEFRKNVFHYIELCASEDVQVTRNGVVVAVLSNPDKQYFRALNELCGCLKEYDTGENYDELIGEGIMKKCGF